MGQLFLISQKQYPNSPQTTFLAVKLIRQEPIGLLRPWNHRWIIQKQIYIIARPEQCEKNDLKKEKPDGY